MDICIVTPGPNGTLINQYGEKTSPPANWAFQPAGDAGITRKITAKGQYWRVQIKKGRRTISKGVWAPSQTIRQAQQEVAAVRETEAYKKKQLSAFARRDQKQSAYASEFFQTIQQFLNFHETHKEIEKRIAHAVTAHAIPIGSGTVARTSMIPIEERASRAVIAWMRHNTTAYDQLSIKRIKGERRRVRRLLAEHSVALLRKYRQGIAVDANCPLQKAIGRPA
ncbi:DUF2293 domain-containing protein [Geofilum rubicundum]|uniref:DUF2293 domain-containing protein n=1 Tax=Geofilum rubicundum JCM 15548 TaxID=1236989 RepID=A0A0E9LYT3_9BACT|nr:DUF2293 domain-containing protein [Geofilum rubicundum]GAO30301.1 hypothetical protein JCM15548_12563 [Geofilum rubicundum JCM 15548]